LNPVVVTLRRHRAAHLRCLMTDRSAFRELGKTAERWRDLAERRRDYFTELHRSGRWQIYYEEHKFRALLREVAAVCELWAMVVAEHQRAVAAPDEPAIARDAA
jgi:uncharacterized repeat protein (TIGR03809 family)